RLHDLAAVCNDRINGRGDAINHDVDQQAHLYHWFPAEHPSAAHFANRIIKGNCPVAAGPGIPTEDLFVEVGGSLNIARRHFQVADLAVSKSRMLFVGAFSHWCFIPFSKKQFRNLGVASLRVRSPRVSKGSWATMPSVTVGLLTPMVLVRY